ncbi:MAG TPA: glycosyltransferase family 4 protein [Candidatus Limnocylindrales bacterium]|jgi:hypothetical protein|nr:glycosyltransferase family 4 protein [Candidatus Limnocylindrales bacterium]
MNRLRILTWHVHGAYLESLARVGHELVLPTLPDRPEGYGGAAGHEWPNVCEVPADEVRDEPIDLVLYQSQRNWLVDRDRVLSPEQQRLPSIFLEHDPPRESPTDTRHVVDDPNVLLVHVTAFNALMWDSGRTPVRVIEHGVAIPRGIDFRGGKPRGVTVVNHLAGRGRRLGADVFVRLRAAAPLDLLGMGSERLGGLGEVDHDELAGVMAEYRFFLHPVRYTSLGLALIEAMMVGLPVVGLATTELPTVIENGVSGYVATDPARLVEPMQALLGDRELAARIGAAGREQARARFGIERFVRDWDAAFREVAGRPAAVSAGSLPVADRSVEAVA